MNQAFTYFAILAASLAGPLALSFDKKVAFYSKWKYLFSAMIFPCAFYIGWDMFFTSRGVWSFNAKYIMGINIGNLPIEEVLFFVVVPYCCIFIYECIRCYFPKAAHIKAADTILRLIGLSLFITGLVFIHRWYTSWTFILNGIFIGCIYLFKPYFKSFDAAAFLISYVVMLLPFLVVNGFLTALPVVLYNDAENLGIRIYTIPFEDTFYGMLLVLMIVVLFEKFRSQQKNNLQQ